MSKDNIKEIISGEGLGELRFGMKKEDVLNLIGDPNDKETFPEGDEEVQSENWHYDELELSIGYDQEDELEVMTVSITSQDYKFKGFSPIGLNKEQLTKALTDQSIEDLELEDMSTEETPSHELISCESLGMNFWFEKDVITEVQWGPIYS